MRNGSYDNNFQNVSTNKVDKKETIKFFVWLAIMLFVFYEVISLVSYTLGKKTNEHMYLYNAISKIIRKASNIDLSKNATESYTLKYAALGDIYITPSNLSISKVSNKYDFTTGTENMANILKNYDLVTASLDTPVSTFAYSTTSRYNSPTSILDTLKSLNINTVATANYHMYDKELNGIKQTEQNLKDSGINQVGMKIDDNTKNPIVYEKNNIRIGILSYCTSSNITISKSDKEIINQFSQENINSDIKYLRSKNVDYIIAYISIPNDGESVNPEQKNDVEQLFNSGVNIVFCTGQSCIMGQTQDEINDKNSNKMQVYAIYSLGDFIGKADTTIHSTSLMADITFNKKVEKDKNGKIIDNKTKKSFIVNKPTTIYTMTTKSSTKMYTLNDVIDQYKSQKIDMTKIQYNNLLDEQTKINNLYK